MVIDSKQYNGICSCGKIHKMETEFCIIESGCLNNLFKYMDDYNIGGYCVAVYDENTYKATEGSHPKVDAQIILPSDNLHANEHGVQLLKERLPEQTEVLIAIGSGTIHDITRYCAYDIGVDFVSCPTAASVDGFCSSVAAMTWNGCKKTLTAVAPKIVVADLDIIKKAPIRLAKSGFGDMVGKYIALTDWKIGNILVDEYYCDRISQLTFNAAQDSIDSIKGIIDGDAASYEKLIYGLLMSGLAMQMIGNSRPASGAEHHISHIIEMEPESLNVKSDALHGEKVGVGTLIVMRRYKSLVDLENLEFADYDTYSKEMICKIFGDKMSTDIIKENEKDCAVGITADLLISKFNDIKNELIKLPDVDELNSLYNEYKLKKCLEDINVDNDKADDLLCFAPMVRNRLTLLRLISAMCKKRT